MFRACLDTSVLVPSLQRDYVLQLAALHTYAPIWGSGTLAELGEVLARLDAKLSLPRGAEYRERLLEQMQAAFPGATIEAPADGFYPYDLSDPDDGHVAHAAIYGGADALVSSDRRAGFETSRALQIAEIEVLSPASFVANTAAAHPRSARQALIIIASRSTNPPRTPLDVLTQLRDRYGMVEAYDLLHRSAGV